MRGWKSKKLLCGSDVDLKPMMNLIVVLIPIVLVSVEFAKIAVIDIKLPDRGSTDTATNACADIHEKNLSLTALVTDSVLILSTRGGFLPHMQYREYHRYIAGDDCTEFTVEYKPGSIPRHPVNGREMNSTECHDMHLLACDSSGKLLKRIYTRYNELVTDNSGNTLESVFPGDTIYTVSCPRRVIVVRNTDAFQSQPLSIYDEFQNRIITISERYRDAIDAGAITIAAENSVVYDKIVQLMDKARQASFQDISIARVRGFKSVRRPYEVQNRYRKM